MLNILRTKARKTKKENDIAIVTQTDTKPIKTCDKCPYKYKTQHTYKSGMVGTITMCSLYDKQLYYYGDSIPKPNYEHDCFEEDKEI